MRCRLSTAQTPIAPTPVTPVVRARRPRSRRKTAGRAGANLLGGLVFFVMVFPVYWMVATAFKPGHDILSYTPKWFPVHATLQNFRDAVDRPYFWTDVRNSLVVVGAV